MSSIDPQIDAFVPKMRAAAARHDGDWTMDGYPHAKDGVLRFISRARRNLDEAYVAVLDGEDPSEPLCDAANLCALSDSIQPVDEEGHTLGGPGAQAYRRAIAIDAVRTHPFALTPEQVAKSYAATICPKPADSEVER